MHRRRLIAILMAPLLAGCVVQSPAALQQNPYPPPPPRLAETRPPPPPDAEDVLIWRPGGWEWVGTGYVWQHGEYEKLGTHSSEYQPGHWEFQNGAWNWVRSHWL